MENAGFGNLPADLLYGVERIHRALEDNRHIFPSVFHDFFFGERAVIDVLHKNLPAFNLSLFRKQMAD